MKRKNPNLKLLVSLRPDDYFSFEVTRGEGAEPAASQPAAQQQQQLQPQMNEMHQKFAKRIRDFIVRHALDGVNLDWPYFAQTMQSANASRDHLSLVLAALNENFHSTLAQSSPSAAYLRLQLPIVTLTTSKDFYSIIDGYDFHQINKLLDFVHLPAFDFDLNVDQYSIGHPARLHGISDAENLDTLVDLLLSSGLPSEQLIAGIPSHGVQITSRPTQPTGSEDAAATTAAAAAANLDEQLEAAANISIVSHADVCRARDLAKANCSRPASATAAACWTMSRARDLTAPFAYDSEHWIGFDDETSVKLKAKYVLLRHLAGVAMFTVNHDDPTGRCGFGPYPLLATVNGVFARAPPIVHPQQQQQLLQQQPDGAGSPQQAAYFTRAPNQLLTATSLMSQIFGKKLSQPPSSSSQTATSPTPSSGDLMSSASDQSSEHRAAGLQQPGSSLMSFVDIIEKYGAVNRLEGSSALAGSSLGSDKDSNGGDSSVDQRLPCDRVGYQRYPRDCSRFYRCVQTPPATPPTPSGQAEWPRSEQSAPIATTSLTRLQYECPSGLVFDEQYQICNWPSWSAQCTGSGEVNSINNARFVCPNYGYFQNQENCEYFYYCSDYNRAQSQAYQFRCPFELGFDEERLQCNWKWLVKGCNVSSSSSGAAASALSSQNQTNPLMLAQQRYVRDSEARVAGVGADFDGLRANAERSGRRRRSAEEAAMTPTPATTGGLARSVAWSSRMTSILASMDAIIEHRMRKAAEQKSPAKLSGSAESVKSGESGGVRQTKYPSFVGSPQTTAKPAASTSFRSRRRQATSAPSSVEPLPDVLPYKPRPPPPSIFPFLPSSAIYMMVDSFRSVREAIQGELNRYMRVAGDRMRNLFGQRGQRQPASRADSAEELDSLLAATTTSKIGEKAEAGDRRKKRAKRELNGLSETGDLQALESSQANPWPQPVHLHHQQQQQHLRQYQQQRPAIHSDPLGRPPGYPLNPLDAAARAAVLGPEPKVYSQPSALMSGQFSAITQQDYERLMSSNREALNQYSRRPHADQQRPLYGGQMGARPADLALETASSVMNEHILPAPIEFDREKMIVRLVEQARPGFSMGQLEQSQSAPVPFGMPAVGRATMEQQARQQQQQGLSAELQQVEAKKRRTTVAMKLASLALPKMATVSPPAMRQQTQQNQPQQAPKSGPSTKSYRSLLPSFSNVVVAPARNIMSKAMDINKAMHDLISTLAPGGKGAPADSSRAQGKQQQQQQQQRPLLTTPIPVRPIPLRNFKPFQQQQQLRLPSQQLQMGESGEFGRPRLPEESKQSFANRSALPLLLSEQEARALSAQLDQLSREQLEALSNQLFSHPDHPRAQASAGNGNGNGGQRAQESQDYVTRLLKVLSQSSQNPEDIKLLDQLAGQLNNPSPQGQENSLIEVGQPDDLALLEALGFLPQGSSFANSNNNNRNRYSYVDNQQTGSGGPRGADSAQGGHNSTNSDNNGGDNLQAASHQNYRDTKQGHPQATSYRQVPRQVKLIEHSDAKYMDLDADLGTTKFVPVRLEFIDDATTPTYQQEPAQTDRDYQPARQVDYQQQQQHYYQPPKYYTTSTTTTTQRPRELITQVVEEQLIERPSPPVKQTFTELIETNVTTPDGIETSLETRTKTAVSGGASFNIGSQLGLGLIPAPFAGSLPAADLQQQVSQAEPAGASQASNGSTDSSIPQAAEFSSQKIEKKAKSQLATKGGSSSSASASSSSSSTGSSKNSAKKLNLSQSSSLSSQAASADFGASQAANQLGGSSSILLGGGSSGFQGIPSGGQISAGLGRPGGVGGQFAGQLQTPIGGPTFNQLTTSSFKRPSVGSASLSSYNFATQPVDQFEEVVIKKKFKPFPKQVMVQQTTQDTVEEVKKEVTPAPVILQTSFVESQQQQQPQTVLVQQSQQEQQSNSEQLAQQQIQVDSSTGSTLAGSNQAERIREEDVSTVASTFGESVGDYSRASGETAPNAGASLTKQELQLSQQLEQQRRAQDLQRLQLLLDQNQQQQALSSQSVDQFGGPSLGGQTDQSSSFLSQNSNPNPLAAIQGIMGQVESVSLNPADASPIVQEKSAEFETTTSLGSFETEREQSATEQPKAKKSKGRRKKKRPTGESGSGSTTTTSTSTAAPKLEPKTPRSVDENESLEPRRNRTNRVEAAFTNFMVELKRSRKSNSTQVDSDQEVARSDSTSIEASANAQLGSVDGDKRKSKKKKRKSRSKKGSEEKRASASSRGSDDSLVESGSSPSVSEHLGWESEQLAGVEHEMGVRRRNRGRAQVGRPNSEDLWERRKQPRQGNSEESSAKQAHDLSASASRLMQRSQNAAARVVGQRKAASIEFGAEDSSRAQAAKLDRPLGLEMREREQVAIYGTKSGFIPIIRPDDPSYHETRANSDSERRLRKESAGSKSIEQGRFVDPLSLSASYTSSKQMEPEEMSSTGGAPGQKPDVSWKSFVRRLSDQISVVNLGNYTERASEPRLADRVIQVKLVILPASPNNQLLKANNWNHLAAHYPQLFPANMGELNIGTIELGGASIAANSGLIDEDKEELRCREFARQFEQVSGLIEQRTFKALDEIVQRSSGRLFMMQRKDDGSRTIIAVIPDKPLISQRHWVSSSGDAAQKPTGGHYQRQMRRQRPDKLANQETRTKPLNQISTQASSVNSAVLRTSSTTSTTTTSAPISTSQRPSTSESATQTSASATPAAEQAGAAAPATQDGPSPQKAAAFSRAIQESIQDAIRLHYDSMKSKLRLSMAGTEASSVGQQRHWSTPPPQELASLESGSPNADPMEASSSSTEYSIVRLNNNNFSNQTETTTSSTYSSSPSSSAHYGAHPVYEIDGAEPKALYGLDFSSQQQADTASYLISPKPKTTESETAEPTTAASSRRPKSTSQPARFISIGSHLIASPMKLPKVVDQAYVHHFYDHISNHQLAKAVGLDEIVNTSAPQEQEVGGGAKEFGREDENRQQEDSGGTTDGQAPSLTEESLVPESACTRAGLFQHPFACNKFYECFWDKQLSKFTLHMFECPIKLAFDDRIVGCAMPIESSLCVNY